MVRKTARSRKATALDFDRLTWMHLMQLLHGTAWNPVWGFRDADELVATWKLHRARLLEMFAERRRPWEQAPFAQWLSEFIPDHGERLTTEHFGTRDRHPHLRWGILHMHTTPPTQESEADYLRRHGLM